MADEAGKRLFLIRLGLGLAQGLLLYFLYHAQEAKSWPATSGMIFGPLLLLGLFIPLLLNQALGEMPTRRALLWGLIAGALIAVLGVYDLWSAWPTQANGMPTILPSPRLFIFCAAGLFIAHALVVSAAIDRRFRANYATHFDIAWKQAVQLALTAAFVGAFWLMLVLGANLFALIKLEFFRRLIEHQWFSIPVTALAVAGALHLTDIRPALVRGVRTLGLTLLSWLLPLLTLIVAGFLFSLPFTGLAPLWAVGHASALLLAAAAVLVVLINAAHQGGDAEHLPPRLLRWSGTLAALLPLPLGAIAIFALYLRVQQYGWTEDRVLVAAALTVAGFHALGYARAAILTGISDGRSLQPIESWNFFAALLTLAMMALLSSPLADPRRIAVSDQMARLQGGAVKPEEFDFGYLRRDGGRYGRSALAELSGRTQTAKSARDALNNIYASRTPAELRRPAAEIAASIKVYPTGKALPPAFISQEWNRPPEVFFSPCLRRMGGSGPFAMANNPPLCEAVIRDLDGDGRDEILLLTTTGSGNGVNHNAALFQRQSDGSWHQAGNIEGPVCDSDMAGLRSGSVKFVPAAHPDIQIGARQAVVQWTRPPSQRGPCPENRN
ncbi:MAG: DUF4153 domain-containing protein [Alphaproteobacteria bacterium]|nr:DUF4153 domain-containing protein [Alphaproteobacteria bacterium]